MTKVKIDLQKISKAKHHRPHKREFDKWFLQLQEAVEQQSTHPETYRKLEEYSLTVRIVDEDESLKLNSKYRSINHATNVLSFIFEPPVPETKDYLGDLVFCGAVIEKEARELKVDIKQYWAKMFIHGCLHLHGYAHENDDDYAQMEEVAEKVLDAICHPGETV